MTKNCLSFLALYWNCISRISIVSLPSLLPLFDPSRHYHDRNTRTSSWTASDHIAWILIRMQIADTCMDGFYGRLRNPLNSFHADCARRCVKDICVKWNDAHLTVFYCVVEWVIIICMIFIPPVVRSNAYISIFYGFIYSCDLISMHMKSWRGY